MIAVTEHTEGASFPVRAQPGAKRNALLGERSGALRVSLTAPPEQGRANDALREFLAESLGVRCSRIALLTGQTSRIKRILILGLNVTELSARLAQLPQS